MATSFANAAHAYSKVQVHSGVEEATPHQLIALLMGGVLSAIAVARGHVERGEIQAKGHNIGKAIDRIEGLRTSLDLERGGEPASNLSRLYDYMKVRLLEANLHNRVDLLDEVSALLLPIKSAWDGIAPAASARQAQPRAVARASVTGLDKPS